MSTPAPVNLLIAIVGGIVAGLAATGITIWVLSRHEMLDVPNERSSHTRPTLRGGGFGLAAGALAALAISHTGFFGASEIAVVVAGVGFGAIGFADDLAGGLPVTLRMLLQLITAIIVAAVVWEHTSHGVIPSALLGAVAILWIISFVNAFNFMDGINGISCAEAIVAGTAFGLLARHEHQPALQAAAFALVAGSIGFAPFNFPTARVFLGDVGSYFAGAWLAVLVVLGLRASIPAEAMLAPVALYVTDTSVALARRIHRHEAWRRAHREHIYQRLVDLGWSQTRTTGLVFTLVALCSLLGSVSLLGTVPGRIAADCGVAVLIGGYLALPGLIEHRYSLPSVGPRTSRAFRSGAGK